MKMKIAVLIFGTFFQVLWLFCEEFGGKHCFYSPLYSINYSLAEYLPGYLCILVKNFLEIHLYAPFVCAVIGICFTFWELAVIVLFILSFFPKYQFFNCILISFSIACQTVYLYCDSIGYIKYCPRNFIKEYLNKDFESIINQDVLQVIRNLELSPSQIESLAYLGLLFTIAQFIVLSKNLIGQPLTIIGRLVQRIFEVLIFSSLVLFMLHNYSDLSVDKVLQELKQFNGRFKG